MNPESPKKAVKNELAFAAEVGAKEARKLKARKSHGQVWLGLGMMGVIGWSVALPTLLAAAVGLWLDKRHPTAHSWTLAFLVGGLVLGCLNAWHWVAKEDKAIQEDRDD